MTWILINNMSKKKNTFEKDIDKKMSQILELKEIKLILNKSII